MPLYNSNFGTQRPELADALYEYQPDGVNYFADLIAPRIQVSEASGQFEVVKRETMLQNTDDARTPTGEYKELDAELTKLDYTTTDRGLTHTLKDGDRQTIQLNREMMTMRLLKGTLMRNREKRIFDLLFNTSTWTGADLYTDTATTWATVATCDPVADVIAAKKKVRDNSGVEPNAVIMSATNFDYCLISTKIRGFLSGIKTPSAADVANELPRLMGVNQVIVCNAVRNTAPEGKSASITPICSNSYVSVAHLGSAGDPSAPAVMLSPEFAEDSANPYVVESYISDEKRGLVYRVRNHIGELVVEKYFAHLLKVD
jgi:hypothetical protein